MPEFTAESLIPCSRDEVFSYHQAPGALERLIPPWESIEIAKSASSIDVGQEVELRQKIFGFSTTWRARHTELHPPERFEDQAIQSPFRSWIHRHEFEQVGPEQCRLIDRVQYELPIPWLSGFADGWLRGQLRAMFQCRHAVTRDDLSASKRFSPWINAHGRMPKIGVTGASGLIGQRVVALAAVLGWEVIRIQRPESRPNRSARMEYARSVVLDPTQPQPPEALSGLDAVVHLAGFGIAEHRWRPETKQRIRDSRVTATRRLVESLQLLKAPPRVLVSASGIGFFGDSGQRLCNESSPKGQGFLADLASEWEAAAAAYTTSGNRVVQARMGMVLHPRQGALASMLPLASWGLGGPLGNGNQYWPWVHVDDAATILLHSVVNPGLEGPIHVTAPQAVTQRVFAQTLGRVLHRPAFLPAPAWGLRLGLGEMADALLLASNRVETPKLLGSGYPFRYPELEGALQHLLGRA